MTLPAHTPVRRSSLRIGMLVGSTSVTAGGVSEAVHSLAAALGRRSDVSIEIFAPEDGRDGRSFGDIPVRLAKIRGPSSFAYAPHLVRQLLDADLDVLHVHGLWMYMSIAAWRWARATGRPYVVSPHGMLDPWALDNNRIKKQLAMLAYEGAHLTNAACLHALCEAEATAFRQAGLTAPVSVLPNGVDAPGGAIRTAPWRSSMPGDAKVALFLGRVTAKKRVADLIKAFDQLAAGTTWHLVIVGPIDSAYQPIVHAAAAGAHHGDRIHIVGPAYGEARSAAYASADLFVLPSISEGLPLAALEAFAFGVPALLTPQCNLPEAVERGAALEIESSLDGIAGGLRRFFAIEPEASSAMGHAACRLAGDVFNWNAIAERMAALYGHLSMRHEPPPAFVRALSGRAGLPA